MAKKRTKKEDTELTGINDDITSILADTDGQTLRDAGKVPYFVDTGNLSINFCCSGKFITGGFPGGRIIEAFGAEASGKSLLGYCFLGAVQRMDGFAVLLDCERSSGAEFAERCGHVDSDRLLTYSPITFQQVEKKVISVVNTIRAKFPDKPIGIVWDSIGVNTTDREWNETELPENPTAKQISDAGGNARPGERAKAAGDVLRKLNPFLNENNATLYIINQVRKKIGVMFGDPDTTAGGGEALKFYASMRFRTGAPQRFTDKDTKMPLGVNMKITNKKNRHNVPGLVAEKIPLFFDSGIHPTGGLLDILVKAGRVKSSSGKGVYEFVEGYGEGSFRSSLDKPLDPELIIKNYKCIDAESEEEVKAYIQEWENAIALSNQDSVIAESSEEEDLSAMFGNKQD